MVPAPALDEVAAIWWDLDATPEVRWRADGPDHQLVELVDPTAPDVHVLLLARVAGDGHLAREVAVALAEGLAACDFPPTGTRASAPRVAATLRVAGLDPAVLVEPTDEG
ncbi:MAG: hypothetical protein JJT89_10800 [Nitriliruptoraceae bacterium]|nr:hypothetical protein [Nitriliruptoraceae bacterium]